MLQIVRKPPPPEVVQALYQRAKRLYRAGHLIRQIEADINVGRKTIHLWIKNNPDDFPERVRPSAEVRILTTTYEDEPTVRDRISRAFVALRKARPTTLIEQTGCLWPVLPPGEDPIQGTSPIRYCNLPLADLDDPNRRVSYCCAHQRLAYRPRA